MKKLLTVQEMQQVLSSLEYDGFEMEVYEGWKEGCHFCAKGTVPDSLKPGKMIELEIHSAVPPQVSIESFELFVSWRMTRIEIHESMEKLKIRNTNEPLYSPHRSFADRDEYL